MVLGVHLGENLLDAAFGVDDERRAQHTHVLAAVHRLLGPHAVGFQYLFVGIGDQVECQIVFDFPSNAYVKRPSVLLSAILVSVSTDTFVHAALLYSSFDEIGSAVFTSTLSIVPTLSLIHI